MASVQVFITTFIEVGCTDDHFCKLKRRPILSAIVHFLATMSGTEICRINGGFDTPIWRGDDVFEKQTSELRPVRKEYQRQLEHENRLRASGSEAILATIGVLTIDGAPPKRAGVVNQARMTGLSMGTLNAALEALNDSGAIRIDYTDDTVSLA